MIWCAEMPAAFMLMISLFWLSVASVIKRAEQHREGQEAGDQLRHAQRRHSATTRRRHCRACARILPLIRRADRASSAPAPARPAPRGCAATNSPRHVERDPAATGRIRRLIMRRGASLRRPAAKQAADSLAEPWPKPRSSAPIGWPPGLWASVQYIHRISSGEQHERHPQGDASDRSGPARPSARHIG